MTRQQSPTDGGPRASGMPMLGLGTWQNEDEEQCAESVRMALESGYRHIDTAQIYENESAVGDGIAAADVSRDEVFLATKVWISSLSYDDVIQTTKESLDKLGVDSVDLLYVHWAAGEYEPEATLPAFDELVRRGLVDNVGVSNFEPHHVETAMDVLDAPVFANQVEIHPFLQQSDLREHAATQGYELVAYSPLARGEVFGHDIIESIADDHDASEAQVSLTWLRAKGVTAIPKATSEAHITDNLASLDLSLTAAEIDRLDSIDTVDRRVDPDWSPAAWD